MAGMDWAQYCQLHGSPFDLCLTSTSVLGCAHDVTQLGHRYASVLRVYRQRGL